MARKKSQNVEGKKMEATQQVPGTLTRVNPFEVDIETDVQSRCAPISPAKVESMAVSLATSGQLQPILARLASNNKLQPVAGFTRTRAARLLREGFTVDGVEYKVPDFMLDAKIVEMDEKDAFLANFIENIERNDLTAVDVAIAQERMRKDFGMLDIEIARVSRMSPAGVTRNKRVLALPPELQDAIHVREMTVAAALALIELPEEQRAAFLEKYGPGLSVAQIHEEIRRDAEKAAEAAAVPTAPATPSNDATGDNAATATGGGGPETTPVATPPRSLKDMKDFWTGYLTAYAHSETVDDGEFAFASSVLNWMNGGLSNAEMTEAVFAYRMTQPGERTQAPAVVPAADATPAAADATPPVAESEVAAATPSDAPATGRKRRVGRKAN